MVMGLWDLSLLKSVICVKNSLSSSRGKNFLFIFFIFFLSHLFYSLFCLLYMVSREERTKLLKSAVPAKTMLTFVINSAIIKGKNWRKLFCPKYDVITKRVGYSLMLKVEVSKFTSVLYQLTINTNSAKLGVAVSKYYMIPFSQKVTIIFQTNHPLLTLWGQNITIVIIPMIAGAHQ